MLCPHCGHDNPAGRKYCRGCAKSLAADAKPVTPPASGPAAAGPIPVTGRPAISQPAITPPVISKMAIASLGLSFLAFLPPVGIVSVVMGHISRRQIAASQGRQTGSWFAFAGLILSYAQLLVMGFLFLLVISFGFEANHNLDRNRYVRAALVERILNGDPNHPSAAVMAKNGENLMDALHLIQARQETYQAEHSGNYACALNYLEPPGRDDELTAHVRNSHYALQLVCRRLNSDGRADQYAVSAVPRSGSNPPNAPIYCLDETKVIRRYTDANEVNGAVLYQHQPCPEDGQPAE
jgi:hypothetical protein